MFAKLFIVALAVVCAAAAPNAHAGVYPLAYSAGVVPAVAYSSPVASYSTYSSAPVASYSTYSSSPVAYSTYSSSPVAYSTYSAPVVASPSYYYGRSVVV